MEQEKLYVIEEKTYEAHIDEEVHLYNYENQFLVLKPGVSSKGKDMTADDSIWYARNGFGCIYGARGQAVYAESLLTGKYIHWERHDFCGIVKPESLKEWLLDKPVRNEAAEELTKFVTPELISAAKQNHTACGYPFLIGYAPAEGGLHEAFCLDPDPVNLASFIVKMGKERGDLMICTPLDTPFLNTFGTFIDRCADQDFLQKHLLPVLVPMQMGETEPQAIKLTEDQDNEAFLDDFAVEDDSENAGFSLFGKQNGSVSIGCIQPMLMLPLFCLASMITQNKFEGAR